MASLIKIIPNLLTWLRLLLVIPVVLGILNQAYIIALILFVIAGLSDAVDGYWARRYDCVTRFGSIADPIMDKILLLSCFTALGYIGAFPWWLFILLCARDLYILAGAFSYHLMVGSYKITPHLSGKLHVFLQIATISVVLLSLCEWLAIFWVHVSFVVLFSSTVVTILIYSWVWWRRAYYALKGKNK